MNKRTVVLPALAFLVTAAVGGAFVRTADLRARESERRGALDVVNERVEIIDDRLDEVRGALMALSTLEAGSAAVVAGAGSAISSEFSSIRSLELIPWSPEVAARRDAIAALESNGPHATRPAATGEGLSALVVMAVTEGGNPRALATAVVAVDRIVAESDLSSLGAHGLDYELTAGGGARPVTLERSTMQDLVEPVKVNIEVAGGQWILSAAPRNGWRSKARGANVGLALLVSLLVGIATREILKKPEVLEQEVEKRARRLLETNRKLMDEIVSRERAEEQVVHEATHDSVTGLPNRLALTNRIDRMLARGHETGSYQFAILTIVIDRYTSLRDSLGPSVVDEILVEVTHRLEACLRPKDFLARIGGGEFSVILFDIEDALDISRVAERFQEQIRRPVMIDGLEVFLSASIGVATGSDTYLRSDEMLRDAGLASSWARAEDGGHVLFDPQMHERALQQLKVENELRLALDRDELRVYYQPIVLLSTGRIAGFEALVRWEHPVNGLVAPGLFLPVAESTGLILELDRWVLSRALHEIHDLNEEVHSQGLEPVSVSVNLSGKQFRNPALVDQVGSAIDVSRLDPRCVRLEITESVMMEDAQTALGLLDRLKQMDLSISIDDFGTGYSSLAYLRELPIDILKIDQSFVRRMGSNLKDEEIVKIILLLANALELKVIAEGVETIQDLTRLRELLCTFGQGYHFSRPVPYENARKLLLSRAFW